MEQISIIEPSPHDAGTAYVAVERHRLDDHQPYIYKTTDFGKTWTKISRRHSGQASTSTRCARILSARACCMPAPRPGVFVSFDDGAHWQSLQLNLPHVPVHDLVVKNDDLAIATHGAASGCSTMSRRCATGTKAVTSSVPHADGMAHPGPDEVSKHQPVGENPPAGALLATT